MKSGLRILWLLCVVAVVMTSCREKEDDVSPPVVKVVEPYEGQVFAYGDTIFIRANISHIRNITFIKVGLVNGNQTPVLPMLNSEMSDADFFLVGYLVLDDVYMESGQYAVQIKVSDAYASWNTWVDIQYIEGGKELISLVAVVK